MREPPNKFLRIAVPLIVFAAGLAVVYAFAIAGRATPTSTPTPTSANPASSTAPATATAANGAANPPPTSNDSPEAAEAKAAALDASKPEQPPAAESTPPTTPPATPAPTIAGLRARPQPIAPFAPLGSLTPASEGGKHQMEVRFSHFGAGIESLTLANHFEHFDRKTHEVIQKFYPSPLNPRLGATPFALEKVEINGQSVNLALDPANDRVSFWTQAAPGEFVATIEDGDGREVARVKRRFALQDGAYWLLLDQKFENLTTSPMTVTWYQFGPVDLPQGVIRYGGDVRRLRFGYLLPPRLDPDRVVQGSKFLTPHADALGKPVGTGANAMSVWGEKTLWPNPTSAAEELSLVWAAMTSRYFTVAMHGIATPVTAQPGQPGGKDFRLAGKVDRFAVAAPADANSRGPAAFVVLRLTTPALTVAPGQTADVSMYAYAGPMAGSVIDAQPPAAAVGLSKVIIYTFGGPCAFCTFQPITHLLHWFLGFLHDWVVFDWALAIMVLVVCVRTILHPVTRWSQINMLRFSKQMQSMAPKQKALQEKYKGDSVKLREEMGRLMREEHVNYGAGAMGCIPPFLQMPIWIALYAMLFFTFELRQQPAFFGFFQSITGGAWPFLADLAEPDSFIPFAGKSFYVPLLSSMMGPIQSFNILPILLGVVFFIQQKYMTPPPTGALSPEQEQQQKIMKVMMVVMFPLFMYNAPSGLALYFIVNSTLGILESKHIRSHADKMALNPPRDPKKVAAKGDGFFARLQKQIEERQRLAEQAKKMQQRRGGKK